MDDLRTFLKNEMIESDFNDVNKIKDIDILKFLLNERQDVYEFRKKHVVNNIFQTTTVIKLNDKYIWFIWYVFDNEESDPLNNPDFINIWSVEKYASFAEFCYVHNRYGIF